MTYLLSLLISNEGVCRTAPATPGLLNTPTSTLLHKPDYTDMLLSKLHQRANFQMSLTGYYPYDTYALLSR